MGSAKNVRGALEILEELQQPVFAAKAIMVDFKSLPNFETMIARKVQRLTEIRITQKQLAEKDFLDFNKVLERLPQKLQIYEGVKAAGGAETTTSNANTYSSSDSSVQSITARQPKPALKPMIAGPGTEQQYYRFLQENFTPMERWGFMLSAWISSTKTDEFIRAQLEHTALKFDDTKRQYEQISQEVQIAKAPEEAELVKADQLVLQVQFIDTETINTLNDLYDDLKKKGGGSFGVALQNYRSYSMFRESLSGLKTARNETVQAIGLTAGLWETSLEQQIVKAAEAEMPNHEVIGKLEEYVSANLEVLGKDMDPIPLRQMLTAMAELSIADKYSRQVKSGKLDHRKENLIYEIMGMERVSNVLEDITQMDVIVEAFPAQTLKTLQEIVMDKKVPAKKEEAKATAKDMLQKNMEKLPGQENDEMKIDSKEEPARETIEILNTKAQRLETTEIHRKKGNKGTTVRMDATKTGHARDSNKLNATGSVAPSHSATDRIKIWLGTVEKYIDNIDELTAKETTMDKGRTDISKNTAMTAATTQSTAVKKVDKRKARAKKKKSSPRTKIKANKSRNPKKAAGPTTDSGQRKRFNEAVQSIAMEERSENKKPEKAEEGEEENRPGEWEELQESTTKKIIHTDSGPTEALTITRKGKKKQ